MNIDAMPYAPGGHGLLGHSSDFQADRIGLLERLATSDAPIMRLRLPVPGVLTVVVNDPELVQEVMVDQGLIFHKSAMLRFTLYPLAGEGLFSSNGELWRRQRKLMAPMFTPRALEQYAAAMVHSAERTCANWGDGRQLQLHRETTQLTMSVAGKTLFDADTFSEADEIGRALTTALSWTGHQMGGLFSIAHVVARRQLINIRRRWPGLASAALDRSIDALRGPVLLVGKRGRELERAIAVLDDRVQRMIDERRHATNPPGDLLSRLLAARDADDGSRMSDRQVRDEILTLFIAGHETTASGLAWAIYLLSRHPKIRDAVEAEVDALDGPPTLADLPRLGLCLRAFRETLRLYPPVYLYGRDCDGPVTIGGYRLPDQTNVLISPYALQRKPSIWPNPSVFDPDRFLPDVEARRHRHAYLPFGAGPRICIGNHFAYMEAQLALAVLIRRFRFECIREDVPFPEATLRPLHGVPVRVTKRTQPAGRSAPRATA